MGSAISSTAATGADLLFPSTIPKAFVITMVGLDGAGKTKLLMRLKHRKLPAGVLPLTIPTIGSNVETIPFGRHTITVWDFGGLDRIRPLWRRFFWHAHAFVFVVDASMPMRFAEARQELRYLCEETDAAACPVLVLANKIDSVDDLDLPALALALNMDALGRTITVKGVSAFTGDGLDEALEWVATNVSHEHIARIDEGKKHMVQAW
ncbi:ADP-ribosylation factor [Mycena crocata]|nr:ADP-ribosylation factor [Mycena crocata]